MRKNGAPQVPLFEFSKKASALSMYNWKNWGVLGQLGK